MKTLTTILTAAFLATTAIPASACFYDLNGVGYPPECGYRGGGGGGGGGRVAPPQRQHPYVQPTGSGSMNLADDRGEATQQLKIMGAFAMREHNWARAMVIYQQAADYSPNDASIQTNYRLAKQYQDAERKTKHVAKSDTANPYGLKDAPNDKKKKTPVADNLNCEFSGPFIKVNGSWVVDPKGKGQFFGNCTDNKTGVQSCRWCPSVKLSNLCAPATCKQ